MGATAVKIRVSTILASVFVLLLVHSQSAGAAKDDHWVATWATSQQLMPNSPMGGRGGGRGAAGRGPAQNATAPGATPSSTAAPPAALPPPGRGGRPIPANLPATFADQTVRMIVRTGIGGRRVRIELSNMLTAQPLEVGAAHIGIHKGGGAVAGGSGRTLTFSGQPVFVIPPGVLAVSDPVDLDVAPLSELAISLYLPRDTGAPTSHTLGLHTAYISEGNTAAATEMPDPTKMYAYAWLSSVDVAAPPGAFAIVALGDSITDGQSTTLDTDRAWPALLAKRLNANKATQHVSVLNQGISGNQVLRNGAGVSALARFDRDVLSRPGVKWVVLLEGINDINLRGGGGIDTPDPMTAEDLIGGYQQIIARCHMHGIRVVGATIMPEEGVWIATEKGERMRQEVNRWIRTKGNFDAVVDFDAVARDPQKPSRLKAEYNPGDHIHPNDAGNQAMADAFDLSIFKH